MPNKVCHEITYPSPSFNGYTAEVWVWISNFISRCIMDVITYGMLRLKLNHSAFYRYPSGLLHPHWDNHTIVPVYQRNDPDGLCNIGYPSKTHLKLKSREISFVYNIRSSNRFEMLHRARQYNCRALCKISARLDNCKRSYGQTWLHEI